MKAPQSKLGFNRSYSEINNFSLMQSLNISSLSDDSLQNLANKTPEMKHMSVLSINNTLTKIRLLPATSWLFMKVKLFSTIGTPIVVIIILLSVIILYCTCLHSKKGFVCKYTGPYYLPTNSTCINSDPISSPLPHNQDDILPQVIQEILKTCGLDLAKFKLYKHHKARHQTSKV